MATRLVPITPGEILRDEFMAEYGLSQNKLATLTRMIANVTKGNREVGLSSRNGNSIAVL